MRKPKIIFIMFFALIFVFVAFDSNVHAQDNTAVPTTINGVDASVYKMAGLINMERVKNGLKPLEVHIGLTKVAQVKAEDIVKNNYFSHNSPTFGSPFEMIKKFGISYSYAAENIASAQSIEQAHSSFMNSTGHRNNILSPNLTHVGIGISKESNGNYKIVEMFITPTGNNQPSTPPSQPVQPNPTPVEPATINGVDVAVYKMAGLINMERVKNGLKPLEVHIGLTKVAQVKAEDMVRNNYFSHNSPTFGSPFDMMKTFGISYSYAAENIASTQGIEIAHNSFMNSTGHRNNILSPNLTHVGIGISKESNGNYKIVEMFITPK